MTTNSTGKDHDMTFRMNTPQIDACSSLIKSVIKKPMNSSISMYSILYGKWNPHDILTLK